MIGHTTDTGRMIVKHNGAVEADLPVARWPTRRLGTSGPWVPTIPPKIILRANGCRRPTRILGALKAMMGGPHLARGAGSGSSTTTW